jgi:dihydrofolate synthase/folylpolyglutamate synthase
MHLETSLKKLFSLHTFGIKLGLDNTIGFLNHLGNPQNDLKAIHVAGSNGKGSTSSFIASILQEMGYEVGLYTSPHFVKFNERIVINGEQIEDEYVAEFVSAHEKYIDEHQLTFFEVTTAMAFQYFKEMKTDYCVIETGLGGRLDSTNVLNPLAVVITTISLEHTNVLGNTIEEIAAEKAAIIKSGLKVFTGLLDSEAEKIVNEKCEETKSQLFPLKKFLEQEEKTKIRLLKNKMLEINPPLKGDFQKSNASLAALVVAETFSVFDEKKFNAGVQNVSKNTGLSGRYEIYSESPRIIFDSAHNPEGVTNFLSEFRKEAATYKKRFLIFGAMRDKSIEEMVKKLGEFFDEILLAEIQYERAAKPEEILGLCNQLNIKSRILDQPVNFIEEFKQTPCKDCLVVLGSMYLLGEIKTRLQ